MYCPISPIWRHSTIDHAICFAWAVYSVLCFQRTATSTMEKHLTVFVLSLLCSTVSSEIQCKFYEFTAPFSRRHCPTEGIEIPNLSWRQCKLSCLQKPSCEAVNYDFIDYICTYLTATCIKAESHPHMALALLTGIPPEQCIEWIPKENNSPVGDRTVTEDNKRFLARMQINGNDYMSYWLIFNKICYSGYVGGESNDYPCQYLRINDGCTVYYVNYEPGAPLPPNAVIGGYSAQGVPAYIGIKDGDNKPGNYIPGSNAVVTSVGTHTQNVKLLVYL